jgi:hypothetical protein
MATNRFESGWYLVGEEAKYWDGKSWLNFVWSNPPGSYDFPNGSGFWNGEVFSSFDYVDFENKRHQKINSRFLARPEQFGENVNPYSQDNSSVYLASKRRRFDPILRLRYFLTRVFVSLGVFALISILFEPSTWLQAIGTWLSLWFIAFLIEPKK